MSAKQTIYSLLDDTVRRRDELAAQARRLPLTVTSSRGLIHAHPIHRDIARLDRLILRYMRALGLTPLARAKASRNRGGR